jgi:hypothetical protein
LSIIKHPVLLTEVVSEEKLSTANQKQELPVVAKFVNGSGQNVQ